MVAVLGSQRQPLLPDVPTLTELGLAGFEDLPYYGIFAPIGTPQTIIDRYSAALAKTIAQPQIYERLQALGLTVEFMSSEVLAQRERAYSQSWARLIREHNFVAQ